MSKWESNWTKSNDLTYVNKQKEKQKERRAPKTTTEQKSVFFLINDVFNGKNLIVKYLLFIFISKLDSPEGFSVEWNLTTVHKDEENSRKIKLRIHKTSKKMYSLYCKCRTKDNNESDLSMMYNS